MCNFKSALVLRDKTKREGFELFLSPWTESHSTLMLMRGVNDGARLNCARVEFSPPDMSTADRVETFKLRLDEDRAPGWWTQDVADDVAEKMATYIKSCIVTSDTKILIGGQFILASGASVSRSEACVIQAMLDTSQVGEMFGTSQVGVMLGTSKVGKMRDTSKVGEMFGTSQVGVMWGTSQVGKMRDTSQVGEMWGTSQVESDFRKK